MILRQLFLVPVVLVVTSLLSGVPAAAADAPKKQIADTPPKKTRTAKLTIDYGDGVQMHFTSLDWREGMTVLDLLKAAKRHRRGITFRYRGSDSIALLTKIDDLENQGGRGDNWIYRVNGKLGKQSFAVKKLSSSDHVLWKFGKYE